MKYFFRNDYSFGAHPKVMDALVATNLEGNIGYGFDTYTEKAIDRLRTLCECPNADIHFLVGGTQVNAVAIAGFLRPWEGIIAAESSHINGHEAGAVEATGHKIITVPTDLDGKLTPAHVAPVLTRYKDDIHLVVPRLVEIANATESGMIYTKSELSALSTFCRDNDLLLFLDGARLGTALSSTDNDVTLADLAAYTDAFTIGGTKNGAIMGEALVITNPMLSNEFFRMRKRSGAVLAKGWTISAQFLALFEDNLFFDMARHANKMASLLQTGLKALGYTIWIESPTNQIFAEVENSMLPAIQNVCHLEIWGPAEQADHTIIRFVTCFNTSIEDVNGLLSVLPN